MEDALFIWLEKDPGNCKVRSIGDKPGGRVGVEMEEHGCGGESGFERFEGLDGVRRESEGIGSGPFGDGMERVSDVGVILDESLVEVGKTKKGLDFLDRTG